MVTTAMISSLVSRVPQAGIMLLGALVTMNESSEYGLSARALPESRSAGTRGAAPLPSSPWQRAQASA
jgi:hypothetical protein